MFTNLIFENDNNGYCCTTALESIRIQLLQFQKSILLIQTKSSTKSIYSTVCVILSMYPKKILYKNHPKE